MVVSSNTLFQFTSCIETLVKILESHGFWPKYCIEFGWTNTSKKKVEFAVPQSCFCDIPLSVINTHMDFYGHYGIGMSKEWAIKKGISPVLYVLPQSHLIKEIKTIIRGLSKENDGRRRILAYLKKYEGVNYRFDDKKEKWKRYKSFPYYNEREWRYVPIGLSANDLVVKVDDKKNFDTSDRSEKTFRMMCKFEAKDVKYLIVKTDEERMNLIETIRTLKDWDEDSQNRLCSKIILENLLKEDL